MKHQITVFFYLFFICFVGLIRKVGKFLYETYFFFSFFLIEMFSNVSFLFFFVDSPGYQLDTLKFGNGKFLYKTYQFFLFFNIFL